VSPGPTSSATKVRAPTAHGFRHPPSARRPEATDTHESCLVLGPGGRYDRRVITGLESARGKPPATPCSRAALPSQLASPDVDLREVAANLAMHWNQGRLLTGNRRAHSCDAAWPTRH
jgi:hypothetical protein